MSVSGSSEDSSYYVAVPSLRDIYFLFYNILSEKYELIPKYYDSALDKTMTARDLTEYRQSDNHLSVLFEMATWVYRPTEQNRLNYLSIITEPLNKELIPSITNEIVSYLIDSPFAFSTDTLTERHLSQLTFTDCYSSNYGSLNTVVFSNDKQDYITIRSDDCIIDSGDKCIRIDTFIFNKSDEMWIGIIDKKAFNPRNSLRAHNEAIVYYGARNSNINRDDGWAMWNDSGKGQMQGYGKVLSPELPSYVAFDWISMQIDNESKQISFFKNCDKVCDNYSQSDHKIVFPQNGADLYYVCEVDHTNDGFFVEKLQLV